MTNMIKIENITDFEKLKNFLLKNEFEKKQFKQKEEIIGEEFKKKIKFEADLWGATYRTLIFGNYLGISFFPVQLHTSEGEIFEEVSIDIDITSLNGTDYSLSQGEINIWEDLKGENKNPKIRIGEKDQKLLLPITGEFCYDEIEIKCEEFLIIVSKNAFENFQKKLKRDGKNGKNGKMEK